MGQAPSSWAIFFATLWVVQGVVASPVPRSEGEATEALRRNLKTLREAIRNPGPEADQRKAAAFDDLIDDAAFAESCLGGEWQNRTPEERKVFGPLLGQLVRKSWERNLKKTSDYALSFDGEEAKGGQTIVRTKFKSSNDREDPVSVDYAMEQMDGKWKARDVITEGVSLVASYRSQFVKMIKKDGFPALVQKMKDKLAKGD